MTTEITEDAGIVSVPVSYEYDGTVKLYLNFWRGLTGVGMSLTAKPPEATAHGVRVGVNDDDDIVFGGLTMDQVPLVINKLQEVADSDVPEVPEHLQDLVAALTSEMPEFLK